jgi:hypothetical protein
MPHSVPPVDPNRWLPTAPMLRERLKRTMRGYTRSSARCVSATEDASARRHGSNPNRSMSSKSDVLARMFVPST